jgi:hypothetical protein
VSQPVRRIVLLAALTGLLAGCVPQGLAFKTDKRLSFNSPKDRSTVSLPVTLAWSIKDFQITGPGQGSAGGYFGVFVDASPMPPGKPLHWVARKDNACRESDGCPDEEYLNARGIYTTTKTELVLTQLPRNGSDDEDKRERHRVTIVLLDPSGKRIGESAFELAFDVNRKAQP